MQFMQLTNTHSLSLSYAHTQRTRLHFFLFETKADVRVLSNYSLLYRLLVLKYLTRWYREREREREREKDRERETDVREGFRNV